MALKEFEFKQTGAIDQAKKDKDAAKQEAKLKDMSWETFLKGMSQHDLLALRDKIDTKLTGITLADVDLIEELLFQLKKAKELQTEVKGDNTVAANQRAQIQNSIGTVLERLTKYQIDLYDSERNKRMEGALIRVLKTLPAEAQEAFFAAYGTELQNVTI